MCHKLILDFCFRFWPRPNFPLTPPDLVHTLLPIRRDMFPNTYNMTFHTKTLDLTIYVLSHKLIYTQSTYNTYCVVQVDQHKGSNVLLSKSFYQQGCGWIQSTLLDDFLNTIEPDTYVKSPYLINMIIEYQYDRLIAICNPNNKSSEYLIQDTTYTLTNKTILTYSNNKPMLLQCSRFLFIGDLRVFTKIIQLSFGKNLQLQLTILFFYLAIILFQLFLFTLLLYDYDYDQLVDLYTFASQPANKNGERKNRLDRKDKANFFIEMVYIEYQKHWFISMVAKQVFMKVCTKSVHYVKI